MNILLDQFSSPRSLGQLARFTLTDEFHDTIINLGSSITISTSVYL